MISKITSVLSPRWANEEHTKIDCILKLEQFGDEELNFTADPNDVEAHGRAIFRDIVAGTYGEIAPWDPDLNPPLVDFQNLPPLPTPTSPLQFIEKFTEEEQLAIVTATMTQPVIKLWYDKLLAAGTVDMADPRLQAGMNALVSAGLITAERKEEILPTETSGVTVA